MISQEQIFILIPCYNDHEHIQKVVLELQQQYPQIILVDDGSNPPIHTIINRDGLIYLRHAINLGQGAALQTATEAALRYGAEIVVHFDADGQHRVEDIAQLLQPIFKDQADIVLGSRFLDRQHKKFVPRAKRILLPLAAIINGLFTGIYLSDAHNGLRALNRKAASNIHFEQLGMAHASEILSLIKKRKLRYKEVAVQIHYSKKAKRPGLIQAFRVLFDWGIK